MLQGMVSGIAGLRWVSYVRVDDRGPDQVRYTAVGVGHRRPAEVRIGEPTAHRLAGKVPFVPVRRSAV